MTPSEITAWLDKAVADRHTYVIKRILRDALPSDAECYMLRSRIIEKLRGKKTGGGSVGE